MDIRLNTGDSILDVTPLQSRNEIAEGDRLFYELGSYKSFSISRGWYNWKLSGTFKEILEPIDFKLQDACAQNAGLTGHIEIEDYLKHHNFHIKKREK